MQFSRVLLEYLWQFLVKISLKYRTTAPFSKSIYSSVHIFEGVESALPPSETQWVQKDVKLGEDKDGEAG